MPNLKDLKVLKGSGNILLNCLLKKFLWVFINFTLFDASNKIVT